MKQRTKQNQKERMRERKKHIHEYRKKDLLTDQHHECANDKKNKKEATKHTIENEIQK